MITVESRSVTEKIKDHLPNPIKAAALAVVALGWAYEPTMSNSRQELGMFGATTTSHVVRDDEWGGRLKNTDLIVAEPGKYSASIERNGERVAQKEFIVQENAPAFVVFDNVEPRGGLGGFITPGGVPGNFGYGYDYNKYQLVLTRENGNAEAETTRVKL